MSEEKQREKEIAKAIKKVGWMAVSLRIKTEEDRKIYDKLSKEFITRHAVEEDKILKKAGISF